MKKPDFLKKEVVISIMLIIIVAIVAFMVNVAGQAKAEKPETVAKAVLTKTYDITLQDYEDLVNVVEQSVENDEKLYEYLQIRYDDQLTDSGYNQFISDRIPTIGAKIANEENSDIKVSSIELKSVEAVEEGKRYDYALQFWTEKNSSKTYTRKGSISLIQQNGEWKVDSLLPR